MSKAYIIARRAISYRRYITRSARNGYHCKKPLLSGRQKRFLRWRRRRDSNPCNAFTPYEISSHASSTSLSTPPYFSRYYNSLFSKNQGVAIQYDYTTLHYRITVQFCKSTRNLPQFMHFYDCNLAVFHFYTTTSRKF